MQKSAIPGLAAIVLACPVAAQAATDEIVVTGLGLGGSPGDAAYDLTVIDRDRLTMSASGRMEDILRDAAGFQQFRRSDARSAHPTSQGATLRGLGGNASTRALILLDGVPMVDPFGGWVSWANFDPARIGHVRVTRGGGSGVYGPGALAGTIEMSSVSPDQAAPFELGLAYGSRRSIDADATGSAKLGDGYALLSAGYARGDGFIPIIAASRGPIDRAAPYDQLRGSGRVVFPVGDQTELQASGSALYDKRDRGVDFTNNNNLAIDGSIRLVGRGRWGWEATSWLQIRKFASGFANIGAGRATVSSSLDQYNVPAMGEGARFELRPPIGDGIVLRLGGDIRHVDGRTQEIAVSTNILRKAGGEQGVYGGFAEASFDPGETITLTASGRIDHWSLDNGVRTEVNRSTGLLAAATSATYADRSGTETSARAGVAWHPAGAFTLRTAAYSGWRLPTLNELYRPFRAGNDSTVANPLLNPERVKGVEAGAEYHPIPGWKIGATLFWNKLDDAISNVTIAANTRQRQNVDAIRSRGVEVDAAASYGPWHVSGSYSHVDATVRSSGAAAALGGLRPAQTPRDQLSATLQWNRPDSLRLGTTVRYVASQYEDDQNSRSLASAWTVDAIAQAPIGHGLTVELRGENLTNTEVQATIGADGVIERATPRTLWVGLRYSLR